LEDEEEEEELGFWNERWMNGVWRKRV